MNRRYEHVAITVYKLNNGIVTSPYDAYHQKPMIGLVSARGVKEC